jgi:hypothetical protein
VIWDPEGVNMVEAMELVDLTRVQEGDHQVASFEEGLDRVFPGFQWRPEIVGSPTSVKRRKWTVVSRTGSYLQVARWLED